MSSSPPAPPHPPEISARHVSLPKPLHTNSPQITSILHDPCSSSLALRHVDSSYSLYPSSSSSSFSSQSPLLPQSLPNPKTLIPSPNSSATFLRIQTSPSSSATALFVTSSSILRPSSAILLRFYVLRNNCFVRIKVNSNQRDLEFDGSKFGVAFRVNHGVSVKLSGGFNVFALHSVSSAKVWVFAVRLVEGEEEGLKLMKCAVIDCCCRPVFTVRVLFGFLFLGEEGGVRGFSLHQLVKGGCRKERKSGGRRSTMRNGVSGGVDAAKAGNGVKLRSTKLRQDSRDFGAFFVALESKDVNDLISMELTGSSVKSISIEAVSANYFVVLDSAGDVHLLCLSSSVQGSDISCHMNRLSQTMKVLKLAVFQEVSAARHTIWMSDGCHTVHLMMLDCSFDKTEKKDTKEKLIQTSVTQAIFASENIQDIAPLAANAILVLGQGGIFAHAVS